MRNKIRVQGEPSFFSGLGQSEGARRHHLRHFEAHGVTITVSRATPAALPISTAFSVWSSVQFPVGTISPSPEAEKQTPPSLDVTCSVLCFPLLQMMKLEQRGQPGHVATTLYVAWDMPGYMSGCILQRPAASEARTPSCPHQPLTSILSQPHPGHSKALSLPMTSTSLSLQLSRESFCYLLLSLWKSSLQTYLFYLCCSWRCM